MPKTSSTTVPTGPAVEAPKAVGKAKVKRVRASGNSAADEIKDRRFEQVLRLIAPYTLDDAEQNYRKLIKQHHPDPKQEVDPQNSAASAELNDAIAHFRMRLG